ncbi:MAG: endolytic transglycosylase MltG [Weeksellaceae bacterium]
MRKLIILVVILAIIGISSFTVFKEGTLAVDKSDTSAKMFMVKPGEPLDTIINNLASENLIRNRIAFYLVVKQLGIETKIQAGDFRLSPSMDAYTLADNLTRGTLDVWVTIPEGLRKEEIAEIVAKEFDIPETEFNELATEGYLFPDTYLVPKNPTAQQIIDIMGNTFTQRYTPDLQAKARDLGLTDLEVLTLASLVEREAKFDEDRAKIASVMLNRIEEGMPLQIDATVQYALGYQPQEKRWWKSSLTFDDLEIDSPYNTYQNPGLPPGPIGNPGMESIEAVLDADPNTPYLFYVAEPSGETHYAETFSEHQKNIDRYL